MEDMSEMKDMSCVGYTTFEMVPAGARIPAAAPLSQEKRTKYIYIYIYLFIYLCDVSFLFFFYIYIYMYMAMYVY